MVIISLIYWINIIKEKDFDCLARLHTLDNVVGCERKSVFDIYLYMSPRGKGYIFVSGEWSCDNSLPKLSNGIMNFSYVKQGNFYSFKMQEKNPQLEELLPIFKYRDIKLKVTEINSSHFIMSFPNETMMICTEN